MVANYDKLQKPDKMPLLEAFLTNSSNRFTHALVMEPHKPCFFKTDGMVFDPTCAEEGLGSYGCGKWGEERLWPLFKASFAKTKLVHVVPWTVLLKDTINAPEVALHTRSIIKPFACVAHLEDMDLP